MVGKMQPQPAGKEPALFDGPGAEVTDPRELLLGYLDWYRDALLRKIAGLSDAQLRTPVGPMGWSPLGMVKHLGWVERRWIQWGFNAEDVTAWLPDSSHAEYNVTADEPASEVLAAYHREVERTRELCAPAALADAAKLGGRFAAPSPAPSLGRILFHLLQEYARHVGHLDIARELIDGSTGE
jgi:uncharacterized damage-inducible protein DinB